MSPKLGFILVDHFYCASFPYLDRQNPPLGCRVHRPISAAVEESSMGQQIPAWYGWGGSVNTDKSRRRPSSRSWSDSNDWTLGSKEWRAALWPAGMKLIHIDTHIIDMAGLFWYESVDCFLIDMSSYNYTWLLDTYDITCHTWVIMVIVGFK